MPKPSHPTLETSPLAERTNRTVGQRLAGNFLPCLWNSFWYGTIVLVLAAAILTALAAIPIVTLRHIDPPGSMLMWTQSLTGQAIDQRWVPLERISPNLVRAVIASEDNGFCRHAGIDLKEIEAAWDKAELWGEDAARGGSTITMQVAKNMFLWNSRSYLRKAIEIPLALAIEQVWPKERIVEVYLNIAEWGPGIFGAEAAAQRHFLKPASRLTEREAALLAAALPNPMLRVPSRPSQGLLRVAGVVERRARRVGTRASCVLGR